MRVGTIGRVVAAAALVLVGAGAALRPAPTAAVAEACFGQPATIVGSGAIAGTPGDDVIVGSPGNDVIDGNGGYDAICGGNGDDLIRAPASRIDGGPGDDRIETRGGDHLRPLTVLGGPGADRIEIAYSGVGHVRGGPGNDVFRVAANPCCFLEVYGDEGADDLLAQGPANLFGGPGADRLENWSPNAEGGVLLTGDAGDDACLGPTELLGRLFVALVRDCEVTIGSTSPQR